MNRLKRIAFIGNHLPRRCGIATFTHDLHRAVSDARPDLDTCVIAMNEPGGVYDYALPVRVQIRDHVVDDYVQTAKFLNRSGFDLVSLQHEYGIFGGICRRPYRRIVVAPGDARRDDAAYRVAEARILRNAHVMKQIIERSSKLIVMSERGREFLHTSHGVSARDIDVIAHGIPDFPFLEAIGAKKKLGFDGRTVILTFGLLVAEQRNRDRHRCHARDHRNPAPTRSMWSLARRIPICCAIREKPIARV